MTRHPRRVGRSTIAALLLASLLAGCGSNNPETMIASAKDFIGKHDNKSAIIQLKNALQKTPDNAEARFLLGATEFAAGDLPSAESELRRAMTLHYAPDMVVPVLAQVMQGLGEFKKIIDEFGATQLTSPEAKASLGATLGGAYLGLNNQEEAKKRFDAALALQPNQPVARLGNARLQAMGGDLPAALATVDGVLGTSPNMSDAQFLKADILLALKRLDEAAKLYDQVIAGQPDNVRAHYSRIMLSVNQNKLDEAATQVEAMKKALPQHPQTHYTAAVLALKREDLQKAREEIQIAVKSSKNYLPGMLLAGEIEFRLNSLSMAQDYLQKVLAQAPGSVLARRLLIATYLRSGQASQALETLKPLVAAAPDDSTVQMLAGEVYLGNNNLAEAEKYFSKASSQDAKSSYARTRLGQVKFAEGDVQAGFHELEAAANMETANYQPDILLVIAHLRRNEADQALAALAKLDKKLPNSPIPANLRAGAMFMKGDVAGARKNLEHALQISPTYFPAALTLARLDAQDKNWDSARKRFETILEKDPKNVQALLALSQVRSSMGAKAAEVEEPLTRAVAANPTNGSARIALIRYHLAAKNNDKAVSAAQDAQLAVPEDPEILDALGMAQLSSGQVNEAITTFSKLANLRPQAPQPQLRLAGIYLRQKQNELALGALRKALVLKPDLVEAQSGMVALTTLMGRQREAIGIAKDVQRQRPKEPVGYMLEADVFGSEKKWAEAATALRQGINISHAPNLVVALATVLQQDGKSGEADKVLSDWVRGNPKEVFVRTYLAEKSLNAKQYEQAAKQYREILAIEPKNPSVLNNLAWVAGQIKDPRAIEYAEQANTLAPNTPAILDTLAMLVIGKGDLQKGLGLLRQALALSPDAGAIRLNLVKALSQAGQKDAAKKEIEPLLKLDDKNPLKAEALTLQKTL
ncbi:MAG: PEP-CTERM system TPR-repeat protein PrsT [Rhodocyclaceae bacterium]|nr:PEP-CTERM system TPR-repeat protein PrsT [Rhodocyclaceae bacterium]